MTEWELGRESVYAAYDSKFGKDSCEKNNLNYLSDIFGQEFHDAFFAHKDMLNTKQTLARLYVERAELNSRIAGLEASIA